MPVPSFFFSTTLLPLSCPLTTAISVNQHTIYVHALPSIFVYLFICLCLANLSFPACMSISWQLTCPFTFSLYLTTFYFAVYLPLSLSFLFLPAWLNQFPEAVWSWFFFSLLANCQNFMFLRFLKVFLPFLSRLVFLLTNRSAKLVCFGLSIFNWISVAFCCLLFVAIFSQSKLWVIKLSLCIFSCFLSLTLALHLVHAEKRIWGCVYYCHRAELLPGVERCRSCVIATTSASDKYSRCLFTSL